MIPPQTTTLPPDVTLETLDESNFHLIKDYDKQFYSVDRSQLLKRSLVHSPVRATKIAIRDRKCIGYGCMRRTDGECHMICPLLADDETIADMILRELIIEHEIKGQWLDIFVPKANMDNTLKLVAKYGVDSPRDIETVMCTEPEEGKLINARVPWNKIYGLLFNNLTMI